MDASQLFEKWAPPDSIWSRWAKPVLFADPGPLLPGPPAWQAEPQAEPARMVDTWVDPATAFVLDLPGVRSVELGLTLARVSYRPVPLFNTAYHPAALVSVEPILHRLIAGAEELAPAALRPDAPPAFLLDANRSNPSAPPAPGKFDNRWVVFPQDFPSASFLLAHGIKRVVLLQDKERHGGQPSPDLAHVLLRWQEAGVELYVQDPAGDKPPEPLNVKRPSSFRSLLYRALTVMGLRRHSAGGFGSIIPQPSSGAG